MFVDLRGLSCPMPALRAKEALKKKDLKEVGDNSFKIIARAKDQ